MGSKVIIISKKTDEIEDIHQVLSKSNYVCHRIEKINQIGRNIDQTRSNCILIDIDSIDVDNRTIRELTIEYPSICFLCMSKDRFHPELKEAICYHIYACLTKPIDYEELLYWLRCIDNESSANPENNNIER